MLKSHSTTNTQENPAHLCEARRADAEAPLVLIVEDHADSRFMLHYMLEMWKYRVIEAENGAEAVTAAKSFRPDLILMDVSLPDTDGFAVARRIRAELGEVPVVFLSGYSRNSFGDQTAEFADYFVKPIGADELKYTVGKYCAGRRKAA